jgi:hypothetical protein
MKTTRMEEVPVVECDSCKRECKKYTHVGINMHFCERCERDMPKWVKHNIEEVCHSAHSFSGSLSQLSLGIWVIWEGREDLGDIREFENITEAKLDIIEMDEESDSQDGPHLMEILVDGKPQGARLIVKRDVVLESEAS